MVTINYKDGRPIHEQVRAGFVRLISTGILKADDKMPSVRELASNLAINPNTIQKAYAWLESEGYIYSVAGRGSFVSQANLAFERRKDELMDRFEKVTCEMIELSIDKKELIETIEKLYEVKEEGTKHD